MIRDRLRRQLAALPFDIKVRLAFRLLEAGRALRGAVPVKSLRPARDKRAREGVRKG